MTTQLLLASSHDADPTIFGAAGAALAGEAATIPLRQPASAAVAAASFLMRTRAG
ncbi:hypothetical protein Afe04nite_15810 [Asanoa ferruginea]|nr:hypothetical protein Afe04nite_15810 [Asanoa ferruginea]